MQSRRAAGKLPAMVDLKTIRSRDVIDDSRAFREASLKSETHRTYAVLVILLLLITLVLLSKATQDLDRRLVTSGATGIFVLLLVQGGCLAAVRWARRNDRPLPQSFVIVSVVAEALIPSGIIFSIIHSGTLPPYAALSSPPLLAFGVMLMLTTLRLRPSLCLLAGALAAGGYFAIYEYVVHVLKIAKPTTGLPRASYVNISVMLFLGGIAAAWVTREIRGHMRAALREAETRREMERIEQDLAIARSIQQALLPKKPPQIEGFEVAGWNKPADQTGGDYYDWQMMPDGNWVITLADVSGHGIGPAMVTAACRAYVRASSTHHKDLSSLTSQVNRLLAADLPDGRFVTMANVLIDPRGGPVALLSAGHGPIAMYVHSVKTVKDIQANDIPLAIAADVQFGPAHLLEMKSGDFLALVTDGFVEWAKTDAKGKREEFGLQRLQDALKRHAHLEPHAMINAIYAEVAAFEGAEPQQDDLTMVIIRKK